MLQPSHAILPCNERRVEKKKGDIDECGMFTTMGEAPTAEW